MKRSLSLKIIGVVSLVSSCFFPPLAFLNIWNSKSVLEEIYLEKAETIARSLDANIRSEEELKDRARLLANVQKHIWLDADIVAIDINLMDQNSLITFVSSSGTRTGNLADADNLDAYHNDILVSRPVAREHQRYLRIVTPIHIAKRQVGTYDIELTLEHVDNQIRGAIRVSVISYLVTLLLFVLLLSWLMRLALIKPVEDMNRGVKTIASGNLDYRVNIASRDEIGQLANAFNQMTGDLKESRADLEERQTHLAQEVLERKTIEKRLRESEERFRNLAQTATDAIIGLDERGCITFWNDAAARIFGYTEGEANGFAVSELIVPEEFRKKVDAALVTFAKTGAGAFIGRTVELIGLRKNGTEFPIELSISRMRVGGAWYATGIVRDATERKRMEEDLLKVEKLESVGVLAGGIAHDFNNLLTGIVGNISLVKLAVSSNDEILEILTEVETASKRARELTQQLLTFSRGSIPVRRTASIEEVLREAVGFALRGSNVECEFSISDDLRLVEIDVGQISQVLNNLIMNADQALPEGGTIHVVADNVVVGSEDSNPLSQGEYVRIAIRDTGVGIPQEYLQKIFDPYFTTKPNGSGLGLAVSYSIVQKHDGHIGVETEVGKGTVFYVYLPASASRVSESREGENDLVMGTGRILVLDDEESIRTFAGKALRHLGYESEVAEDGSRAVELYRKAMESNHPFDAVILDLTIPGGIGGVDTMRRLLEMDRQVKAIVSSGYSKDLVTFEYRQYGFCAAIAKPYDIQQLSRVLGEVIGTKVVGASRGMRRGTMP